MFVAFGPLTVATFVEDVEAHTLNCENESYYGTYGFNLHNLHTRNQMGVMWNEQGWKKQCTCYRLTRFLTTYGMRLLKPY